jgi:predicted dehydrogenase
MEPMRIGIIGCGNISEAYLKGAARSKLITVLGVADIRADAAHVRADEFGVPAREIEDLLADREIELVLNLTIPASHAPVDLQIIDAGKHVYSEKPLAVTAEEGGQVLRAAAAKGVRVGCAPDTFLGAGHQACRRAIDEGRIGNVLSGAVTVMSHGMEHWHPNPAFFYQRGGGPVHDIGPYYVTQLVNLLGPVARVSAEAAIGNATRTVTSEPLRGSTIDVTVPTTVSGVMAFASGALVSLSMSWDVWKHRRLPIEIYGRAGSLLNPDPNFFGGEPMISAQDADWESLPIAAHPFHANNRTLRSGMEVADYRIIGLLDMAVAIREGRPHRANGGMALHVLEVLDAFERSAREGRHIAIESRCDRPAPLPQGEGEAVFTG